MCEGYEEERVAGLGGKRVLHEVVENEGAARLDAVLDEDDSVGGGGGGGGREGQRLVKEIAWRIHRFLFLVPGFPPLFRGWKGEFPKGHKHFSK